MEQHKFCIYHLYCCIFHHLNRFLFQFRKRIQSHFLCRIKNIFLLPLNLNNNHFHISLNFLLHFFPMPNNIILQNKPYKFCFHIDNLSLKHGNRPSKHPHPHVYLRRMNCCNNSYLNHRNNSLKINICNYFLNIFRCLLDNLCRKTHLGNSSLHSSHRCNLFAKSFHTCRGTTRFQQKYRHKKYSLISSQPVIHYHTCTYCQRSNGIKLNNYHQCHLDLHKNGQYHNTLHSLHRSIYFNFFRNF